jgi:hypothetical protein
MLDGGLQNSNGEITITCLRTMPCGNRWQGGHQQGKRSDLGQMANLRLVDKRGKELVELKLQVLA